ncbi:5242_t:CDS:2, partial [Gigaspora margarita]
MSKHKQKVGDGHWEGTCDYCETFYPCAKPQNLQAHLANFCKKVPEEWRHHFNYIIVNNLEDIPTDEPFSSAILSLVKQKKIAKQPELTNWYDSTKIEASKQLLIDEAIILAFIMCSIPFHIINNPFFINALNLLNPSYSIPSREVLLGRLLDIEVAKVISKVDKILEHTNNLSIDKILAIISDNGANVASLRNQAVAILNQKILLHQISGSGLKTYVETRWTTVYECVSLIVRLKICLEEIQENYSEIISFFTDLQYLSNILLPIKKAIMAVEANCSTLANCYIILMKIVAAIQNLSVDEYKGFCNYCIEKFNSRFEEFNDPVYQLILKFAMATNGKMSKSCETLITQLQIYKEQKKFINGIPNLYTAPYTIGQLRYTQATKVTPEIMINIAETVFKEFEEEEISDNDDDIEMLNPAKDLYSNEQDLNLSISTFINLESS